MLNVDAINIENLPFKGLEEIHELMNFQGSPLVIHMQDDTKNDVIGYWVDFDTNGSRWLYSKISKKELFNLLLAGQSLKDFLLNLGSDFIFLLDSNIEGDVISIMMLSSKKMPNEYLPKEESYYFNKLPEFYSDYLSEFVYLMNLRAKSYAIKVSSNGLEHGRTVGAKQAAEALNGFSNSIEGYIRVSAYNLMKNDFGDLKKLNRRINKLANTFTPRIADTTFSSFEFLLVIDVVSFSGQDNFDSELKAMLVDGYKNDVLDVDYSSEAEAVIITEKFTEDERKLIYEPIIKVIESKEYKVSFSGNAARGKKSIIINKKFRDTILPKPTLAQVEAEFQKKNIIMQIVVNLKEGDDLTKISKKELLDHMVYEGQIAQTPYRINSPIIADGIEVNLKMPLDCVLEIAENGDLQIYNTKLDIFYESNDINVIIANLKHQFITLYQQYTAEPDNGKYNELKKYLP